MLSFTVLVLALFTSIISVHATVYVVEPASGATCHGGEQCTVTWLDNGMTPRLSAFGAAQVGLYTGNQQLVQTIEPIDVSKSLSLTFTPIPEAGPNSDAYYIRLTSIASGEMAYSPYFKLDQMSGSFDAPLDSATSSIPFPTDLPSETDTGSTLPTVTVGTLDTSLPPISSLSATTPLSSASSTRMVTSSRPTSTTPSSSSISSSTGSVSDAEASSNASIRSISTSSGHVMGVLSLCIILISVL